jgi:hypothetical protein
VIAHIRRLLLVANVIDCRNVDVRTENDQQTKAQLQTVLKLSDKDVANIMDETLTVWNVN